MIATADCHGSCYESVVTVIALMNTPCTHRIKECFICSVHLGFSDLETEICVFMNLMCIAAKLAALEVHKISAEFFT